MKNPKLTLDKMVIVPTKSRFNLCGGSGNPEQAKRRFRSERKWTEVVDSDLSQKEGIGIVSEELPNVMMIDRSELTEQILAEHDLFVFLGGDNHFTYGGQVILQYMKEHPGEQKFAAGVLLDPCKSFGGVLYFNIKTFLKSIRKFSLGQYGVEYWTTLEAKVHNGTCEVEPYPAVGDYYVGEYSVLQMSRNDIFDSQLYIDGKQILPEKGSGLLVAVGASTGAGSWYDNVYHCYFDKPDEVPKDSETARLVVKENKAKPIATLQKGQTLVIDSYNDHKGIVAPDSHEEHSAAFEMGSQAKIWISDLKLPVVRMV